ncbi:MAG: phosphate ABC transporter permease subunit PstC [Rhizobiaceae bacterium]
MNFTFLGLLLLLVFGTYFIGQQRAVSVRNGSALLHSLPAYHGLLMGVTALLVAIFAFFALSPSLPQVAPWAAIAVGAASAFFFFTKISPDFRARNIFEKITLGILIACSGIAVLTTVGIVLSVLFETSRFFGEISAVEFLFGSLWAPTGTPPSFGFIPLLVGTLLIMTIAVSVAGPLGLLSAIYMAEYATPTTRSIFKPVLEMLTGIPTVVLGFFAALTVAPLIRNMGEGVGLSVASESALAAGIVIGMMLIPVISSLSDDVINAVPQSMRDGSYAMGATKSETIKRVVLPAALPGIVSAFILAISRALGETMIVVMAAGLAANLTINPLESVTTMTVQIAMLLVGDHEFDSAKTLAAFALGFVLFIFTLILNFIALRLVQKYKEQYD